MWKLIYNILIHFALPVFVLFSLTREKIRKNLWERILPSPVDPGMAGAYWIHAASVGEAVIAGNLARYITARDKAEKFLITTNTYYTRDLLRSKFEAPDYVRSLPFDIPLSLRRFLGRTRFKALIIIETEIWPNLIWAARRRKIPVIIVNGRISDSTVARYRQFSFFMKGVFSSVDLVLAQSEAHRERFISIGMDPSRVISVGNMKYYKEMKDGGDPPASRHAITFGSIKEKEIEAVASVVRGVKALFPDFLVFIAPRELHLIGALEEEFANSFNVMRYSVYRGLPDAKPAIVIVDTVGDLMGLYGKSEVAFVGGSLAPYGGQNMLEPLFFGTPVIFGPHVENFREIAAEIMASGAGIMVESAELLLEAMKAVLTDGELKARMAEAGRAIVARQNEVMDKAVMAIGEVVWRNSRNS